MNNLEFFSSNEITIEPVKIQSENSQITNLSNDNSIKKNYHIKEIQDKLQLHGCTLTSLNSKTITATTITSSSETNQIFKDCKYCKLHFASTKLLAKHQLCHLILSSWKLYEKKFINKTKRRGRIISVDKKKCIRCLNCWKIFQNNKETLDHWSNGECDFYCQLCGKEYPDNPKLLREHVFLIHGITYKFSKRPQNIIENSKLVVRDLFNKTTKPTTTSNFITKIKSEPLNNDKEHYLIKFQKQINNRLHNQKNHKLTVQCDICWEKFPNYRSKNSHMRKHKKRPENNTNINNELNYKNIDTKTLINNENQFRKDHDILMKYSTTLPYPVNETIKKEIKEEPLNNSYELQIQQNHQIANLKVENYNNLQNPSTSSSLQTLNDYADDDDDTITIKQNCKKEKSNCTYFVSEDEDEEINKDYMEFNKTLKCYSCGLIFNFESDLHRHTKICGENNLLCKFCLQSFKSSTTLQLHIMVSHDVVGN